MLRCLVRIGTLILLFAGAAVAEQVKILSWNILSYNNPGSAEHQALIRIVQAINPDVILFQEANNASGRSAFLTAFAGKYTSHILGSPNTENPRCQILSVYPATATGQIFAIDPQDNQPFERSTIWADLDIDPGNPGPELRVYTAHYKSGFETRDDILRLRHATEDANHIAAAVANNPSIRIFYAGDLNEVVGSPPLATLSNSQTTLARIGVVDPNNNSPATRWISGRVIDHMYRSATLNGLVITPHIFNTTTYPDPSGIPSPAQQEDSHIASDHLALVATLDIPTGPPPPLINEVRLRGPGPNDTDEFIELSGPPGMSLAGYSVIVIEGDAEQTPGRVERVWNLGSPTTYSIGPNGYFLMGTSATNPDFLLGGQNVLENGTQTILLVQNAAVAIGQDIDTNDDGIADVTIGVAIKDAVAILDSPAGAGDFTYYGAPAVGPEGFSVVPGGVRCPDGFDTDTPADWVAMSLHPTGGDGGAIPTPRAANIAQLADLDGDCDVDEDDYALFEACLSGPDIPTLPGCAATDLDGDGDTDMSDFGIFQRRLGDPKE